MAARPTSQQDLLTALDWALARDKNPESPYYRKIDPAAVAMSGYSCGAFQALLVGSDPRIKTVIVMNSGIYKPGTEVVIDGMEDLTKALLPRLHSPTLYILGGESDIAYPNGIDDFALINHVPAFLGNVVKAGHAGTYWEPNGGKAATAVVAAGSTGSCGVTGVPHANSSARTADCARIRTGLWKRRTCHDIAGEQLMNQNRRNLLGLMALAGAGLPTLALAQQKVLPLDTPGLDHLDVIVEDVEKSARFYMGLFRTTLHAQPFQGAFRYFVLLGPLPEDRAVGYLAVGASPRPWHLHRALLHFGGQLAPRQRGGLRADEGAVPGRGVR